ncbi:hypothetical protein FPHYL_7631 [Fusarium phyllophilum]|uniref:Uncharacterized protein n=1 Tax=Fusarium phyllophilum TaxID=47803 RepID=A0A8H5NAC1_9HYPO|nr:hypothetical protein FPHYL_7631 [Fusarium phyllophilum]
MREDPDILRTHTASLTSHISPPEKAYQSASIQIEHALVPKRDHRRLPVKVGICAITFWRSWNTEHGKGMKWIFAESPVAARVIKILYQKIKVDTEKVLVVTDTPWLQMWTVAVLTLYGDEVSTIRPVDTQVERAEVINDWNSKESSVQMFVANMSTTNVGKADS